MPDEHLTFAKKLRLEHRALKNLQRSNPQLFYCAILSLLFFGAYWAWDKVTGIHELQAKVAAQQQQNLLLETQLSPFKAIALEKYPGRINDALARLGEDVRQFELKLGEAERRIRGMSVEVEFEIQGEWSNGKAPDPSSYIKLGAGDTKSGDVELRLLDSKLVAIEFVGCTNLKYVDKGNNTTLVSYSSTALTGSPIFGELPESIKSIKRLSFNGQVKGGQFVEKKILIHGLRATFSINGQNSFRIAVRETDKVDLSVPGAEALRTTLNIELPIERLPH